MRSYYTLEHRDGDTWRCSLWRSERKRHVRICEAILKSAGIETRIRKETF